MFHNCYTVAVWELAVRARVSLDLATVDRDITSVAATLGHGLGQVSGSV